MSIALIAVIGSGRADDEQIRHAHEVGAAIARCDYGLVCGGKGGVMEAACRGSQSATTHRLTVGILPGDDAGDANLSLDVAIPTGIGIARNVLVVRAASGVVAVGGESGTLSELAHAWQLGRPIAGYLPAGGWGARLAGERLDRKRADTVVGLADIAALEIWLRSLATP